MFLLDVPYSEKDEAKRLGARWHAERRTWFVPETISTAPFARWFPVERPKVELYVDLVPRSAWFSNLRSELQPSEWAACKKLTFQRAKYRCEVCGGRGPDHPVECHERWSYDDELGVQTLIGLIALCPDCHEATHIGSARIKGRFDEARAHLMAVNGWSETQVDNHVDEAFEVWLRRSEAQWLLDATWLLECGVELSGETRQKIAEHVERHRTREVRDWQTEVIELDRERMGVPMPLAHYFDES